MSFLQPLLLFGLPLALLPILIHLLNRLRYRSVQWGAMMFVLKANRSSTSMARIRQWLILAARILAIFALILALSRPLLGGWLGWKFSGEPDTVIILLDRSATMGGAFKPGITKLKKAVELIAQSGNEVASSSHIVLIDSAALKVHEIPSWTVLKEIDDTTVTQTTADFPAMYRIALDYMVKNMTGSTEIWSLSDMQQSNWKPSNTEWSKLDTEFSSLPQPVTFRALAISAENRDNRSIYLAKLSTYPGKTGKIIREIVFDITTLDPGESSEIPLRLNENGLNRQLTVKTSGQVTRIRHILPDSDETKSIYGYIALPPDSNHEDNTLYFGFAPKTQEQAVIISYNEKAADLLGAASAPEGKVRDQSFNIVRESEFNTLHLDATALAICQIDPGKKTLAKLRSFAIQGGYVLFMPPTTADRRANSIWGKKIIFEKEKEPFVADWNRKEGPLADTVSGDQLYVDNIKLIKRVLLKNAEAMSIATCSDGKQFLYAEKMGKGMSYYCATLPLKEWSNLGDGVVIVPMLRRLMQLGAQRLSSIVIGNCGLQHPEINIKRCKILLSSDKDIGFANPAYNTGIYTEDDRITVLNSPSAENIIKELDDVELKTLFTENSIRLFREKNNSSSKMQSEIWRIFLVTVILALILEAFLCTPRNVLE